MSELLPGLRRDHAVDVVIANGENIAGGLGVTRSTLGELCAAGVDVVTSGNHIWHHSEIVDYLADDHPLVRPLNYPPAAPGRGYHLFGGLLVVNLIGRTFMASYDCPFRAMDALLASPPEGTRAVVVDFHAEATSEKLALGHYLDGRVAAVLGTHTHVQTADERVLAGGTAYVTDCGMTGPLESVLGIRPDIILRRYLTGLPTKFELASGPCLLSGAVVEIDAGSGRAMRIERVARRAGRPGRAVTARARRGRVDADGDAD